MGVAIVKVGTEPLKETVEKFEGTGLDVPVDLMPERKHPSIVH
jgi:hypothetical protein